MLDGGAPLARAARAVIARFAASQHRTQAQRPPGHSTALLFGRGAWVYCFGVKAAGGLIEYAQPEMGGLGSQRVRATLGGLGSQRK
ncbi:hypothetical protein IWW41_006173 [Coemansia sp. RSA 2522]|nr:hypothetical protein IWW41_006173 [Coemansia sp. RSA 2522]